MNLNIQQKLFLLLAGVTTLVLVVVLFAVNSTTSENITQDVFDDFKQTQSFFQTSQGLRYDRLVESAFLIQENSTFKANVELNDSPSMQVVVERQFAPIVKADLFVVTNSTGQVLSWLGNKDALGEKMSRKKTISRALQGKNPPLQIRWPDLWAEEGKLYQVVSVPIYAGGNLIGTITLGTELTEIEAKNLVSNTSLDVVFFLDNKPIARSKNAISKEASQKFIANNSTTIDSILTHSVVSEPFISKLNGNSYFTFVSPLGKGESAFYMASAPKAVELQILDTIQGNIFSIGLITILVIIPFAIYLGRVLSKPINSLSKAMLKVQDGELDISVEPKTNDEVGSLTKSFNQMVVGLRERFALQKYVGGHTLKMIKEHSKSDADLGGSRQNLAILFTDIRDSTKSIEKEDPETFIKHLNQCLTYQSEYVAQFKGSIDKYVGDAMIALFDGNDALQRAVQCAIAIQKRFKKEKNQNPFFNGLGIGINNGSMLLGNMGAKERMDYTVIGPEVNLCARLCGTAKSGQILLSKSVAENQNLDKNFSIQKVASKSFKGFSKQMEVVEVHYD